ncbi:MAG: YunC family protein [Chloroflexi bacterium]|nr:YunC family protein [Chloroflexota bacterium]
MAGQIIIKQSGNRKIVVADSAAAMDESTKGDVFVDGSHCGVNVGEMTIHSGVGAMIGNDAGMGKNDAGIAALKMCDEQGIPAAAVAAMSAKVGSGMSTYEQGQISAVNEAAKKLGVSVGMSAKEAADKLLEALAQS